MTKLCRPIRTRRSVLRQFARGATLAIVLAAAGCGAAISPTNVPASPTSQVVSTKVPASPTPQVVSTRLTALLVGELAVVDNCVRVKATSGEGSYLLVWPADFDFSVSGTSIHVRDKLLSEDVTWRSGDIVRLGGGEIPSLDDQLRGRVPANCEGPYWLFGGWLKPTPLPW